MVPAKALMRIFDDACPSEDKSELARKWSEWSACYLWALKCNEPVLFKQLMTSKL